MTEREWLQATDPRPMLEFLRDKASGRKLRLFVAGCIRSVLTSRSKGMMSAAEIIEGHAEREILPVDRTTVYYSHSQMFGPNFLVATCPDDPHEFAEAGVRYVRSQPPLASTLLRDIFGPLPFREVCIHPAWLTWQGGLAVSMARWMYDSRDFTDMPVLTDALEEAGCSDPDILRHCREPGEHVRGCWVVDLLLGKS
jgi:hypothetical protein